MELELPIIAEVPERYTESPPPTTPEYTEPSVIDNYYYAEGPPVVTYYPPPWDYYYMYAWVPSPFWCSGFFFPGFFILHDFHRVVFVRHRHPCVISNHFRDSQNRKDSLPLIPRGDTPEASLGGKDTPPRRGFNSTEARNGARSILERSRDRLALSHPSMPITAKRTSIIEILPTRGLAAVLKSKFITGKADSSGFNGRNGDQGKPPAIEPQDEQNAWSNWLPRMGDRTFSRPDSMNRQNGMNLQRPSPGETRSFSPPSHGRLQRGH